VHDPTQSLQGRIPAVIEDHDPSGAQGLLDRLQPGDGLALQGLGGSYAHVDPRLVDDVHALGGQPAVVQSPPNQLDLPPGQRVASGDPVDEGFVARSDLHPDHDPRRAHDLSDGFEDLPGSVTQLGPGAAFEGSRVQDLQGAVHLTPSRARGGVACEELADGVGLGVVSSLLLFQEGPDRLAVSLHLPGHDLHGMEGLDVFPVVEDQLVEDLLQRVEGPGVPSVPVASLGEVP